jgi:hypothetical protein
MLLEKAKIDTLQNSAQDLENLLEEEKEKNSTLQQEIEMIKKQEAENVNCFQ